MEMESVVMDKDERLLYIFIAILIAYFSFTAGWLFCGDIAEKKIKTYENQVEEYWDALGSCTYQLNPNWTSWKPTPRINEERSCEE